MKKLYVDSCVFISYLTNEMNTFNSFKGERYYSFFDLFYNKTYKLVISTWVIIEVKRYFKSKNMDYLDSLFENMIDEFKSIGNIIILRFNEEDKLKARGLDSNNYPDALHVILAHKCNCSLLTTENIVDFIKYKHLIEIIHPLDLM
ncbi:MAG: type II toxin-antitoxin system VapC family toxin [Nanoarchaeota archaeon]|nr:type II toxin-antitoxin system VapC family toxin [Nanoarchaeota archaeon]